MTKKSLDQAKKEHDKFLKRMGCLPEQIKDRKKKPGKLVLNYAGTAATYFDNKALCDVLQGDTEAGTKHDIIANLYKLSDKDQKSIKRRASQVGVLVNKSGYGVITPGMDPKTLGRK